MELANLFKKKNKPKKRNQQWKIMISASLENIINYKYS